MYAALKDGLAKCRASVEVRIPPNAAQPLVDSFVLARLVRRRNLKRNPRQRARSKMHRHKKKLCIVYKPCMHIHATFFLPKNKILSNKTRRGWLGVWQSGQDPLQICEPALDHAPILLPPKASLRDHLFGLLAPVYRALCLFSGRQYLPVLLPREDHVLAGEHVIVLVACRQTFGRPLRSVPSASRGSWRLRRARARRHERSCWERCC